VRAFHGSLPLFTPSMLAVVLAAKINVFFSVRAASMRSLEINMRSARSALAARLASVRTVMRALIQIDVEGLASWRVWG
jgi:sensor domain CHASE-containing protein